MVTENIELWSSNSSDSDETQPKKPPERDIEDKGNEEDETPKISPYRKQKQMTMNPYIIRKKIRFAKKTETKLFTPHEEQENEKQIKEKKVIKEETTIEEETIMEEETVIDEETGLVEKAWPADEEFQWGYLTQPDVEEERKQVPEIDSNHKVEVKNFKSVNTEDLTDEELVMYHFQDQIKDLNEISSWDLDSEFINLNQCPIARDLPCDICERLCFSKSLRGDPPQSLQWFKDVSYDSASDYHDMHFYFIRYKFLRFCLPGELKLRNITRAQLLDNFVTRFRGYYEHEEQEDHIDYIMRRREWYDIKFYLEWKHSFDWNFLYEWQRIDSSNYYCTGCGLLAHKVYDHEKQRFKQVCSDDMCEFEHFYHDRYVRVDPEHSYKARQKANCIREEKDRLERLKYDRIQRAMKVKKIPEEGHEAYKKK